MDTSSIAAKLLTKSLDKSRAPTSPETRKTNWSHWYGANPGCSLTVPRSLVAEEYTNGESCYFTEDIDTEGIKLVINSNIFNKKALRSHKTGYNLIFNGNGSYENYYLKFKPIYFGFQRYYFGYTPLFYSRLCRYTRNWLYEIIILRIRWGIVFINQTKRTKRG